LLPYAFLLSPYVYKSSFQRININTLTKQKLTLYRRSADCFT
jgi:hypothetical protein